MYQIGYAVNLESRRSRRLPQRDFGPERPKSLAFEERPLRAAVGNGLLTCGGRRSRDRETLGRFSTRSDGSFRTPEGTGSEPRLSEAGARVANPAKNGGKRKKPRGSLSAGSR
jgi:hypothetical protein